MASAEETPVSPWFEGSVAMAVETANTKGSVLMVCLIQDNSEGAAFEQRFLDPNIAASLSKLNLVALKLNKDSPDGAMFGQIFPIIMVPALYLIRSGMLADFMNSTVDVEQMIARVEKAVDGHFQIPPPPNASVQTTTAASTTPPEDSASTAPPATSPSASVVPQSESPIVTADPSTVDIASSSSSANPTAQPAAANTPRIDNAQALRELMNERKLKREMEEREAEKQREIDRRVSSKALAEAKKELQEKQNKKLKEQLEKEKLAEAEYKKKVKQALEEDKARRKAEKEKAKATAAQSRPEEILTPGDIRAQNAGLKEARNDAGSALAYDSSRLNIRLFDGSSIRNTFKATDTLEQVRQWIDQNQGQCDETYNIVQLIPPRTFTDESKMLRDLDLCPSATLVLKKTTASSSAYSGSGDQPAASLMQYGWSALGYAGRMASSAFSTVSSYNPLATEPSTSSGSSSSRSQSTDRDSKKSDREVSYNGNSTNLE
ncbi:MAG: hypothetical protein J3Q66DRAFT_443564 [Benniella sp.]|nr:MAG: hypothetical protein J3Q66DRAFT_443564 [Benniella sp.]